MSNPHKLLGLKLESALAAAGVKKVTFGEEMGVDPSAVTKWVRGENLPSNKALQWLSDRTGETVGVLLGFKEAPVPAVRTRDSGDVLIPRLLEVAAGVPVFLPADDKRSVRLSLKFVEQLVGPINPARPEQTLYAANVVGDSMTPTLQPGDTLIVQRYAPPTAEQRARGVPVIRDGAIYLVCPPDEADRNAQVKRLMLRGRELVVMSDNAQNPDYKPKTIDLRDQVLQHIVVGRALKVIRDL